MNLPDLSKVEMPKRGIIFLMYIYSIKDVSDLKVAGMITAAYVVYVIAQTYTDLTGKKAEPEKPTTKITGEANES